ncbi:GNAT family N-acetyltransferase [Maribacter sp. MJ134]|uniref:GNAT family acetyltransferase n=2 Tax=Flavobacteriaceae TaxID=49546 RepID=A0A0P7AA85_9FLAO|nr:MULTISPECIES: GNAT family N-acetyltransferase [Flavobacteriaceae]AZQ58302.1 GNAT family N-acetyltransferase [Maribacter sp. MJ134]KPM33810.1 GNAT family acetyltransferase [Croceitalea dokdonensis DOKDO 023]
MIQLNLNNIDDDYFASAWGLYEEAFPVYERRTLEAQSCLLENPIYKFDVFIEKNVFIGFVMWWDFEDFQYIDHFAVTKSLRSKGYGAKILEDFIKGNSNPTLLEVELPDSSINNRRIRFYERLGFKLNLHEYKVPSSIDDRKIDLLVMTYPNSISNESFQKFVSNNHPKIFKSF